MPIKRIGFISVADDAKAEMAIQGFMNMSTKCTKGGAPYLVSSKASKCTTFAKKGTDAEFNVVYEITFATKEDMEYYKNEDAHYGAIKAKVEEKGGDLATGFVGVDVEI